jgi:hypothetical protein
MENEMSVLNPDIQEIVIGVRKLRRIKIYPLSVVDQLKITDIVQEALGIFLASKESNDVAFVALLIALLKTNASKILSLVLDPDENPDKVLEEMTNNQLSELGTILYQVNYEVISKNVSGLLKKLPQTPKN